MRTSSRLPALWSSRRLIGTPSSSECSPGGSLAGRLAPGLWFALWIGLGVGLGAGLLSGCRAGLGGVDENTLPPDLAVLPPPPPPCQAGRRRCTADRDATEMCDGMTWQRAKACDLAGGESCVEGVCKKACELVTRGNVGCSFYPVNLWSTSLVGNLGSEQRMEYTAIGDVVNVAARLEGLAQPGQTLCTSAVVAHAGAGFEFRSLGAHPLRGKRQPVEIYEAL